MSSENDKVVQIVLNGSGLPVPQEDPIEVKKDNQKIKWCADFQFTIDIENYNGGVNYGTGGSNCAFNAKTGYFTGNVGEQYKYSISANGKTNDPDILIKP